MEEENNKLEDKRKYFTAAPLKEGLVQWPCSGQNLPPDGPAAANCRQRDLQRPLQPAQMVAEARPTPPSLTSISPSSSALTLQPIDPPPNLSSPLPTIPVHPNHHDLYPCYHHPTHPHHDHLLYSTTAPPKSTGVIKGGTSPIPATTTCSSQTCHHLQTQRPRPTPPPARAIPSHPIPSLDQKYRTPKPQSPAPNSHRPPKSTGVINGRASPSQPPRSPASPEYTLSPISLFLFLGSSPPSKQQVLLSGDTGSQKTREARQVVRRQFPNTFY